MRIIDYIQSRENFFFLCKVYRTIGVDFLNSKRYYYEKYKSLERYRNGCTRGGYLLRVFP